MELLQASPREGGKPASCAGGEIQWELPSTSIRLSDFRPVRDLCVTYWEVFAQNDPHWCLASV